MEVSLKDIGKAILIGSALFLVGWVLLVAVMLIGK